MALARVVAAVATGSPRAVAAAEEGVAEARVGVAWEAAAGEAAAKAATDAPCGAHCRGRESQGTHRTRGGCRSSARTRRRTWGALVGKWTPGICASGLPTRREWREGTQKRPREQGWTHSSGPAAQGGHRQGTGRGTRGLLRVRDMRARVRVRIPGPTLTRCTLDGCKSRACTRRRSRDR